MLQGLRQLPTMKALAPPCMPAIIWRHLAPELAGPIHAALERHWCAETVAPPSHWLDGWLHLIPKPGKPSTQPAALRPLCLQHPILKIVSKILTNLIKQHAYPTLMCLPLYANLPQRGTTECLLRVSQHCQQIRQLCRDRQTDNSPHGLFGGMQVSLDMEKAFDTVRRDLVLHALNQINLPPDVLHMIQTWLAPHKYHIPFKSLVGTIDASRGIKQGSTDAPILWTLCMYLIMQELLQRYSHAWLHDHLIVYADDVHLRWTLNSTADGQCAHLETLLTPCTPFVRMVSTLMLPRVLFSFEQLARGSPSSHGAGSAARKATLPAAWPLGELHHLPNSLKSVVHGQTTNVFMMVSL